MDFNVIAPQLATENHQEIAPITSTAGLGGNATRPAAVDFAEMLADEFQVFVSRAGEVYATLPQGGNLQAYLVGSATLNSVIRLKARALKRRLKERDIAEINEDLRAHAQMRQRKGEVWVRVAPVPDGVEIDLGDETHDRIRLTPGEVSIIKTGSTVRFVRPNTMLPMPRPATQGDLSLLDKYVNVSAMDLVLFKAYLSYTLVRPKSSSSKYVLLSLLGGQGTGKTTLCKNILQALLDPSSVGVQKLPSNAQDLAIVIQNSHLAVFDNLRDLSDRMSDDLCKACTGGAVVSRKLYTNSEQHVTELHGAVALNGIYPFIDQPDLAQRTLSVALKPIAPSDRRTDAALMEELSRDMPAIFRGLLDLAANIFARLPAVKLLHAERMVEFSQWLGAMELVCDVPPGVYQQLFSASIAEGQLDSIQSNTLCVAVMDFAFENGQKGWSGTPSALLEALGEATFDGARDREWPKNPIALSKRLGQLSVLLASQGIEMSSTRGRSRRITLKATRLPTEGSLDAQATGDF